MRIVHLTTSDISGGAARAASRLHIGLQRLGVDSQVVCAKKAGFDPATKLFKPDMRPMSRLRRKLRRSRIRRDFARYNTSRPPGYELFSDDRNEDGGALLGQIPPCDL